VASGVALVSCRILLPPTLHALLSANCEFEGVCVVVQLLPLTNIWCSRNLDEEAIGIIDRPNMLRFLLSLKRSDGSFSLHDRGESDTRGSMSFFFKKKWNIIKFLLTGYCAVAVAHMCGLAGTPNLFDLSGEWLSSCQTFEGGFGGEPGCEAHVRRVRFSLIFC
jgi:prenyltransferase beta subunit